MTSVTQHSRRNPALDRPQSSSLADVLDTILDKGLVIDVFVRVSLVGIEILTIDARIVIASVDTYLRFAEAVNRLDLADKGGETLPDLMENITERGAQSKTKGAARGALEVGKEKIDDFFGDDEEPEEEEEEEAPRRQRRKGSK